MKHATFRRSFLSIIGLVALLSGMIAGASPAQQVLASHTPNPTSVTIAGSLQSELGCAGDWDPACAATHLAYDAGDDVWQGTWAIPADNYEYKAALNDNWNENYGLHAVSGGANIPLNLGASTSVKFYYDHKTHWVTDNQNSVIAVAPGSFQSELGCAGDWDPTCLRSWLQDPDGDGIYTFETTTLPAGSYETKVAINEDWSENYGQGGVPGGANIPFNVPVDNAQVTFSYDAASHMLTVSVATPAGAPGWPGALSHFDLARKDCLGTARNTTSKVWYTVAGGVLSDVYYPTLDNTNNETLQYIVTDGTTFTDLQSRDMTYTVSLPDSQSLDCQVTATARSGKYRIITDYFTDPDRNTLVMNVRFVPLVGDLSMYKLYVRYDALINGNGGGGAGNGGGDWGTVDTSTGHAIPIAYDTNTTSQAVNRTYAEPVFAALDASNPFAQVSNGFAGSSSDGLVQLDATHSLGNLYTNADNGNLVQTAQVDLQVNKVTLVLGFGSSQADAVTAAEDTLSANLSKVRTRYDAGWHSYDQGLIAPPVKFGDLKLAQWNRLVAQYYLSANVLKASEDKTFPGALVASVASPWGQAVSAGDPNNLFFGSYREVFGRDAYEAWTGLLVDNDLDTARDVVRFLFNKQQLPDGSMPRNSLLNGQVAPDSFGTQLDEASYPILMAYQLGMTGSALYKNHIKPAANFVMSHGPAFGVERWEEQSGYSPSTIAAEIAGLVAAADIAKVNGDMTSAQLWLGAADDFQRSIETWTVTTNGSAGTPPYYIRLSKTGDPNAAISYNVGNGGPTLDQRNVIDAGFLELVRLGIKSWNDPNILNSLPVVDAVIKSTTASGPGWHRYNGDGYGDDSTTGHPWAPTGQGTGHVWPLLTEERGEYEVAAGNTGDAITLLDTLRRFGSGVGLIPEQNWEFPDLAASPFGTDPTVASIGFQNGGPAGSAAPLTWAAGTYLRLLRDIVKGTLAEQPANTVNRYINHTQGQTTLTVTAPADQSAVSSSPVTVSGTTAPGNTVYVAATNTDNTFTTSTASVVAAADGSFSINIPVDGGTSAINVVAVSPGGATAHVQRSVVFDFVPGTQLLDVTDPAMDDNGPGNYAYPTSDNFKPGAYDLTDFKVILSPDSQTVTFRVQIRDLTPTFGSPLGAQLVDVYVHNPGAATTSTAASFLQRNYTIDAGSAWSRLIEVQGFGQRYIDANGTTQGTVNISANAISRFISFSVPTASLGGTPGSGWGFTVVLTGQDGFSSDQARGFQPTPQDFQFGVCATASSDPHCTFNPDLVPKAVDVIAPTGVTQSTELDYTLGPVVIQGVTIP
jgi:glucoamylase